ncbi:MULTISPECIES: protein-disulfide reductase DsbD family protein [Pseudomonadaceae]|uniref:protein-disulfide reductase DsbD family protein n=1 Tax=Pseudomonadaceae TaxID=135621 RepID=UPI0007B7F0C2|nr:cytochrome c biogenesis protein CcdA [Stutzerimonas frequens]KZX54687.1 cytochrome C biogenesis protein [Stutzerimonas frequens]MBK3874665.1 DUF255 domain-containing protein [Stutzerimonas frequens]MBK3912934.1 DUF255 domain-containing protein [Stutzerimonas frequens]MBK3932180.1 DUF255 domain-containing protein [Stutzerimonas frequens]
MTDPLLILAGQYLAAVLAGLLLNLTPCVLPAIPIKIRTILRETGQQRSHRVIASMAFLAGTLIFFLTLGAMSALLQWSWGTLFQSTAFVAGLVAVLLGFSAMTWFDVPIPVPQFAATARGSRYLEPLVAGLLSAVLAAPCAGPFLGGVLAFAVTQPSPVILILFSGIGLGLAFPYILLLLNPHWLTRLPKAGEWTVAVRQILSLVLLAAAVFFSATLVSDALHIELWRGWLALTLGWVAIRLVRGGRPVRWLAGVAGISALAVSLLFAAPQNINGHTEGVQWKAYSPGLLDEVQERSAPHLIEFTADWCVNCKVLERTVYASSAVARVVKNEDIVPIQVDMTESHPEQDRLLVAMGGHALPFAVVVNGKGEVIARFTGLFEMGSLIDSLHQATD